MGWKNVFFHTENFLLTTFQSHHSQQTIKVSYTVPNIQICVNHYGVFSATLLNFYFG